MSDLVGVKRLDKLFTDNFRKKSIIVAGKCHICKRKTEIEIVRTSGGYGLNGGTLQEPKQGRITVVCVHCFNSSSKREVLVRIEEADLVLTNKKLKHQKGLRYEEAKSV